MPYATFEQLLNERGVTIYRVAKDTGISLSTFYDWKKGRYTPKLEKLKTIASYFGKKIEDLI